MFARPLLKSEISEAKEKEAEPEEEEEGEAQDKNARVQSHTSQPNDRWANRVWFASTDNTNKTNVVDWPSTLIQHTRAPTTEQ